MRPDTTSDETDVQMMSRLDRDSAYRVKALQYATIRANLREHIAEDKQEVKTWYEYFYHLLQGDGDLEGSPKKETLERLKNEEAE